MTLETMIGTLSHEEKLAAMDLIWRDLTTDSASFVSPEFLGKAGQAVLDQIQTVDKVRLVKRLGRIDEKSQAKVLRGLEELFAP